MKRSAVISTGAALLLACAFAARAQEKVSDGVVKIGMLEDMSSIYADITGVGAVTAAKMAVEDFGGKVLGKPIEVIAADHLNKPDILSATAREVRHAARRRALGCRRLGDRARRHRARQGQEQDRRPQWTGRDAHHQRGMYAGLHSLHL